MGPPDTVLSQDVVDPPRPRAGEVVVQLAAAALNFADVLVCEGRYQERAALPFVPGFEIAGKIVAAGEGAGVGLGTHVVALTQPPAGSFQELVPVAASWVHAIPESIPFVEAGAFHVAFTTALLALERRGRLRAGEILLVLGAAGALGAAAVQLGRALGAEVIAVAGGPAKVAALQALGVHAIDHRSADVASAVLEATRGQGVDVVFDAVGGELFEIVRRCLAFEARIVVAGFASGIPTLRLNQPLLGNYDVAGFYFTRYAERRPEVVGQAHRRLLELYESGAIQVPVRSVVPFVELRRGFQLLSDREAYGRVVLAGPSLRSEHADR